MEQTTALEAEEEPAMLSSKVSEPHKTLKHAGPSRGRDEKQVTAVGIRGQRHPPASLTCCLQTSAASWAQDCGAVERLMRLIQPSECFL